jgi:uncharacterized protein (DUF3084 family)
MKMLSEFFANEDIVASLNRTNESMIKRLKKERKEAIAERNSAISERDSAVSKLDSAISERNSAVAESARKDALIEELKRQLANK